MQMHDMNGLLFYQSEKRPERGGIELTFVKDSYRNWAVSKKLSNRTGGPEHARDNVKLVRIKLRNNIPVEPAATVKATVVTDMVNRP